MDKGNEYNLVEKPALEDLNDLGYKVIDTTEEEFNDPRENIKHALLENRLRNAIKKINPWIDNNNIDKVINRLKKVKETDTLRINKKVHNLLVEHTSVEQDLGKGRKNQTVKYIDYENPENNEFLAINQYRVAGPVETIKPDIVVFVNGIPMGVIECKSPTLTDPGHEAFDQMMRYQNLREGEKEGAERLFWYNQFSVVSWGEKAKASTVGAPSSVYKEWKDSYPADTENLKELFEKDTLTSQDILLYSLFKKERFLELLQFFTIFEESGQGLSKIAGRYQQYRAVQKAMERIEKRDKSDTNGGVVWHTQGSGKSYTMLFLSLKLRHEKHNPTMLLVTDRIVLDKQIKDTFEQAGYPNPVRADGIAGLREQLKQPSGQTITTLVQKFQDKDEEDQYPVLSKNEDIYVLVDEAHRTQYEVLANNMRTALPNAFYIGFSGTPIEKQKKSTSRTFGNYIDTYTIDQSIEDGTTLDIFYQGRRTKLHLDGANLDKVFDRVFKNYSEENKKEIRRRFVKERDLAEAKKRIKQVAIDVVEHFENKISEPFKGMIVTVSRRAAIEFKKQLDQLNAPESAVMISGDHNDPEEFKQYTPNEEQEDTLKKRFKDPNDSLKLMIVCDKLLTGFDAPVAQVMYLDKPLKEHSLLQAIARVNRPYPDKNYGLIIDYYGVSENLTEALEIFSKQDVGSAMVELTDQKVLSKLESAHRKSLSFFDNQDISDIEDSVEALEDEEKRIEFNNAFKKFSKMMDILLPSPQATRYRNDLKRLGEIYEVSKKRYRDDSMNLSGCGEKVREIIQEHIVAEDIKPLNEKPVSIMQENEFDDALEDLDSDKAKASEMKHALKKEISVRIEEDPVFYGSLHEKVEELIEKHNQKLFTDKEIVSEYREVMKKMRSRDKLAKEKGLKDQRQLAFFHTLENELELEKNLIRNITEEIVEIIKNNAVVDWKQKPTATKDIRKAIKLYLYNLDYNLEKKKVDQLTNKLIKLARQHN